MSKKGFTLIELLAVIVILAIIALIATPIVLNIIKDAKDSAALRSAEFYLDGVEYAIAKKIMDDQAFNPSSCDIQGDGNLKCNNGTDVKVETSGEVPSGGTIKLEMGQIKEIELVIGEKTIVKENDELVFEDEDGKQSYIPKGTLIWEKNVVITKQDVSWDFKYLG